MTSLDKALLKQLKAQAGQRDLLGFIKWMVDHLIATNRGTLSWACGVCGLPADADFEQIYKKLRETNHE